MYVYSLLQHYKKWKPDKEETVFRTKKCACIYTPFFSITKTGSQIRKKPSSGLRRVHVFILPSSASQKLEAKQYTQHLQHHQKWELDNTHITFSSTKKEKKKGERKRKRKKKARQYTQHLQLHNN